MDENMSLVTNGFLHNVFNHKKEILLAYQPNKKIP